jgi:L-lactate permease
MERRRNPGALLARHHLLINVYYTQYPIGNLMMGAVLMLSVDRSGKVRGFQRMLSEPQRDRRVAITLSFAFR